MSGYILLGSAIILEIFSTSMMKASVGFTKLIPSIIFVIGMGISFYTLSQALTTIPLSIAYAIWSGVGTAITALVSVLIWKEQLNIYTVAGIALIIIGVVILNLRNQ
ncbi:DMT family transporter [Pectinatus haikarae]|uniref:Small multidrug resistance pump n=1 Tax=Pectinatus haikarae TaxID=349096 RepID=A0ABT9Y6S3_9FIRM|nr:multidrug efflux SMR transporter [Pectinatus haikarae]MDQ0203512.1 small multidrug resistance pump [Pectinatus haikarae]